MVDILSPAPECPDELKGTTQTITAAATAAPVAASFLTPRPDALETTIDFFVLGPRRRNTDLALWAVRVRLLAWMTNSNVNEVASRGIRDIYTDIAGAPGFPNGTLLPGTMVARCRVLTARININGISFDYQAPSGTQVDVLLLLQAENSNWTFTGQARLGNTVCLGGQIPFDRFVRHFLVPQGAPEWKSRLPFLYRIENEVLNSSGIAMDAQTLLPWGADTAVAAIPYLLEVAQPGDATDETPALIALPDIERFNDIRYRPGISAFRDRFAALGNAFQPEVPGDTTLRRRLRWSSLELTDPANMPGFFWDIRSKLNGVQPVNRFRFESGTWNLMLTDQPPRVVGVTPRGVLSTGPEVMVSKALDGSGNPLTVVTVTNPGESGATIPADAPQAIYHAELNDQLEYVESFSLVNVEMCYNPFDVARHLRTVLNLPEPNLDPVVASGTAEALSGSAPVQTLQNGKVTPPVLYGFVPLDDGWAQLPFLNITEQIFADAVPEQGFKTTSPVLRGAASFGTDRVELFDPAKGEFAWNVTLLDAEAYFGKWTIDEHLQLAEISFTLLHPEVTSEGLLWLATAPPSAADALPTFDNWLGALASFPMSTTSNDPNPAPFAITLKTLTFRESARQLSSADSLAFSYANLGQYEFAYHANSQTLLIPERDSHGNLIETSVSAYKRLLHDVKYDFEVFWQDLPLVWRRHLLAPMIQTLPMTQSANPPNNPTASRQLFPFLLELITGSEGLLVPGDWRFAADGAVNWPRLVSKADAATTATGLALASLGLPGVVFDPASPAGLFLVGNDADRMLPAQYRHDLPPLDEVNAIATLPKDDENTVIAAQAPPPPGMQRQDYAAHWHRMAQLAFFAAADERDAITNNGGIAVRNLIEPLTWPVTSALSTSPYPGSVSFADQNGRTLILSGELRDALRGLEGSFRQNGSQIELVDEANADFQIVGESMLAAIRPGNRVRDQRGLNREATQTLTQLLRTRVALSDDPAPASIGVLLTTSLVPLTLQATAVDAWDFWFRDLPATELPATPTGVPSRFSRSSISSPQRRGVNNPAAMNRRLIHQSNYEWRLGSNGTSPLPLGPLLFYPLTLEHVEFDDLNAVTSIEIIGRLHLPSGLAKELEPQDQPNAVRLAFDSTGLLTSVSMVPLDADDTPTPEPLASPINEWPLSQAPGAPLIRWSSIRLSDDKLSLNLKFHLHFVAHGVSWTLPEKDLVIPFAGPVSPVAFSAADFQSTANAFVSIQEGEMTVDFTDGHHVTLKWMFLWGDPTQLQLVTTYLDPILLPRQGAALLTDRLQAFLRHRPRQQVSQQLDLKLTSSDNTLPTNPNLDSAALQIHWEGVSSNSPNFFQVLPGFHLSPDPDRVSRGFGILSFRIVEQAGSVPSLDNLQGGSFEALFACEWGNALQDPAPKPASPTTPASEVLAQRRQRVFGSSAGRIDAAYTAAFLPDATTSPRWTATLLLNGVLEVKSLISWPMLTLPTTAGLENRVEIPAAFPPTGLPELRHLRHTVRVLFNQHTAPAEQLETSSQEFVFLKVKSGQVWTALATVEHQFVQVGLPESGEPRMGGDARFTMVQEVRFCSPDTFADKLRALRNFNTLNLGFPLAPTDMLIDKVPVCMRGYLTDEMIERLTGNGGALESLSNAMLVEASAPAFLHRTAAERISQTNLSYLPSGTTRAMPTVLADYQSASTESNPWLLLLLQFLGRCQPSDEDDAASGPARDLRVDPILQIDQQRRAGTSPLQRLYLSLANWEDKIPATLALAEFDMARNRLFQRLDPTSLRESWFRLNLTTTPAPSTRFSSVMATGPTDEPGGLGRPEALLRIYNPLRTQLPPELTDPPPISIPPVFQWNPGSFLMTDVGAFRPGVANDLLSEFGFIATGVQFFQMRMLPDDGIILRFPAATLLPARLTLNSNANVQPVSIAASPYLGMSYEPAAAPDPDDEWLLALSELVCFDVARQAPVSVATRFWYPPKGSQSAADALIRGWAAELQSRQAADSPVAVVRVRELYPSPTGGAGVRVVYRFLSAEIVHTPPAPAKQAAAVRASGPALRFLDGQYGGSRMPMDDLASFELAPPQVSGVQPIRMTNSLRGDWPWGLSALRVSATFLHQGQGVAGPPVDSVNGTGRIWWQALAHPVQFLVSEGSAGTPVLPTLFRARAIPGLLPAWPATPLPATEDVFRALESSESPESEDAIWQPILPGNFAMLMTGLRPGVPFALRQHLQTQDLATAQVVTSGSVPVMHRAPRPVLLPKNTSAHPEIALQTWAGAFAVENNCMVTDGPTDTAFIGVQGTPLGLDLVLDSAEPQSIKNATIPVNWDFKLRFAASFHGGDLAGWFLFARLSDEFTNWDFSPFSTEADGSVSCTATDPTRLEEWLKTKSLGENVCIDWRHR
jgi:hypothetical protein